MKKEPIILKVKQKTFKQIKTLNLDLESVVEEAFLRGVSRLKKNKDFIANLLSEKGLKTAKAEEKSK